MGLHFSGARQHSVRRASARSDRVTLGSAARRPACPLRGGSDGRVASAFTSLGGWGGEAGLAPSPLRLADLLPSLLPLHWEELVFPGHVSFHFWAFLLRSVEIILYMHCWLFPPIRSFWQKRAFVLCRAWLQILCVQDCLEIGYSLFNLQKCQRVLR